MVGFQRMAFVREDGRELTVRHSATRAAAGIRIYPRRDGPRSATGPPTRTAAKACDTSILVNLENAGAVGGVEHRDIDPLQIVDWKTAGQNLHTYAGDRRPPPCRVWSATRSPCSGRFPAEALEEMRAHYGLVPVAA